LHRIDSHQEGEDRTARPPAIGAFIRDVLGDAGGIPRGGPDDHIPSRIEDMLVSPRFKSMLAGVDAKRLGALFEVFKANSRAALAYRPTPHSVPTVLYRALEGG